MNNVIHSEVTTQNVYIYLSSDPPDCPPGPRLPCWCWAWRGPSYGQVVIMMTIMTIITIMTTMTTLMLMSQHSSLLMFSLLVLRSGGRGDSRMFSRGSTCGSTTWSQHCRPPSTRASNKHSRRLREVLQSRRRPLLLGPFPGWTRLLPRGLVGARGLVGVFSVMVKLCLKLYCPLTADLVQGLHVGGGRDGDLPVVPRPRRPQRHGGGGGGWLLVEADSRLFPSVLNTGSRRGAYKPLKLKPILHDHVWKVNGGNGQNMQRCS